jgi:thioredoxin reductase (NADPH)
MSSTEYDLVIIGGGPAGLTAGLYAVRAKLKTLLLEKLPMPGGQILNAWKVENYPGFPEGISGQDLITRMENQAREFGLAMQTGDVSELTVEGEWRHVVNSTNRYTSRSVIIATGASPNKLGVEGEERLIGRGISFCGTCDGFFFKDQDVILVGGGDTAMEETLFLTRFVKSVTVVHRRDELRATKVLQDRALAHDKVSFMWDTVVEKIVGEESVERVSLRNVKTGEITEKETAGVLIFVGTQPNTGFLNGSAVSCDERGFVLTNDYLETSVAGIFAAGDARRKLLRQVTTAVGDGATAAYAAEKYLETFKA